MMPSLNRTDSGTPSRVGATEALGSWDQHLDSFTASWVTHQHALDGILVSSRESSPSFQTVSVRLAFSCFAALCVFVACCFLRYFYFLVWELIRLNTFVTSYIQTKWLQQHVYFLPLGFPYFLLRSKCGFKARLTAPTHRIQQLRWISLITWLQMVLIIFSLTSLGRLISSNIIQIPPLCITAQRWLLRNGNCVCNHRQPPAADQ